MLVKKALSDKTLAASAIGGLVGGTAFLAPEIVHGWMADPPAAESLAKMNDAVALSSPSALVENMHPDIKKAVLDSEKSFLGSLPAHLGYIGGGYYGLKQYLKHKAAKARRALGYMHY